MKINVDTVKIVEVGPRDGLQNEKVTIPTDAKVAYITALSDAGLRVIEAGAFVSPKWVPQMADTADVYRAIPKDPGVEYPVLVPNMKGLERAIEAGVKSIAIFTAASESFNKRNINMSIDGSFENFGEVVPRALHEGMRVRGYVSTAFGCPYKGAVPAEKVRRVCASSRSRLLRNFSRRHDRRRDSHAGSGCDWNAAAGHSGHPAGDALP